MPETIGIDLHEDVANLVVRDRHEDGGERAPSLEGHDRRGADDDDAPYVTANAS